VHLLDVVNTYMELVPDIYQDVNTLPLLIQTNVRKENYDACIYCKAPI